MSDLQVTCITKPNRTSQHEHITHLGGTFGHWQRDIVIQAIETKTHTFYTYVNGNRGDVGVVNGATGKYLRTYADGKWNDNLLSLREC